MTKALEQAFAAAARLPADTQDELAAAILADIADESRWAETFAASSDALVSLAREALDEHRAGRTRPLDSESL